MLGTLRHLESEVPSGSLDTNFKSTSGTHINGHAVIETFANHSLALDVDILPFLNGQCLNQHTVNVEGHILGLDA